MIAHTRCRLTRLTITLSEETAERLKREASVRRTTVSSLARQALEQQFGTSENGRRVLPFEHLVSGGPPRDVSSRMDEYLKESWADAIAADSFSDA